METTNQKQMNFDNHSGISSQAAVAAVGNRYDLVLIASRRVRELSRGSRSLVQSRRGPVITALNEIEAGIVGRSYLHREIDIDPPRRRRPKPF